MDYTTAIIKEEKVKNLTVFTLALLLILPALLVAQEYAVDKGSMLVGGEAGFAMMGGDLYKDFDDNKMTVMTISPTLMYFIAPGLGIGADVEFTKMSQGDMSSTTMGVGPGIAYFIGNASSTMYPYLSASYIFGSEKVKYDNDEAKVTTANIVFRGGIMFMVAKTTGIGIAAFYSMDSGKHEDYDAVKGNVMGVGVTFASFIFK